MDVRRSLDLPERPDAIRRIALVISAGVAVASLGPTSAPGSIAFPGPAAASAQSRSGAVSLSVVTPEPRAGVRACPVGNLVPDGIWSTYLTIRQLEPARARVALAALHDSLRAEAELRPDDVELQYATAAVIGSRTLIEGLRTKMRLAEEMHRKALWILERDSDHPGARHLLGRLHAAVLRLDWLSRFVATRLFGAGELAQASWDDARDLLELAVAGAPCVPDHHFELARLYAERGEVDLAVARLRDLLHLVAPVGPFADVHEKGRRLLAELDARR